jgi:CheY-like chemotaxis protein
MFYGKILIAEDNVGQASYLKRLLDNEGYESFIVEDGISALEYLNNNKLDLPGIVLTDIRMPKMGGYELIRHIRKYFASIFVVVLTGLDGESLTESFNAGAQWTF